MGYLGKHAIITGGSGGIGMAVAEILLRSGVSVSLLARDKCLLELAQRKLQSLASNGARVEVFACDVGVAKECFSAVCQSIALLGDPSWAISCAGTVLPGLFLSIPAENHFEQCRTNYIGTVNFARAVVPSMISRGGGNLVFVGSGAAIAGIYGYSAYAPSKFAVRGLAEVLRSELASEGVVVTLVQPPDTDTKQLAAEIQLRPKATQRLASGGGVWKPERIAEMLVHGAKNGKFLIIPGWRLRLLNALQGIAADWFQNYQTWMAARENRQPSVRRGDSEYQHISRAATRRDGEFE